MSTKKPTPSPSILTTATEELRALHALESRPDIVGFAIFAIITFILWLAIINYKYKFISKKKKKKKKKARIKINYGEISQIESDLDEHTDDNNNNNEDEMRPFCSHMSKHEALRLVVGDKVDHQDHVGRFIYATVSEKQGTNLKIHYHGWSRKWDIWSDCMVEIHRFAGAGSISKRPAHRFRQLKKGDYIDVNPTQTHPGWKFAEILRFDEKSGQVRVVYEFEDKNYLYWSHLDNLEEIAEFTSKSPQCVRSIMAHKILTNILNVPVEFLDTNNNRCYCDHCHGKRGDNMCYFRGNPPQKYILPIGWSRIGLAVDKGKCKINNVWNDWHNAYHGCSMDTAKEIFKSGLSLLKPGDLTISGDQLSINIGHFKNGFKRYNKYTKQKEIFDTNQIFVSPSIKYAEKYAVTFDVIQNGYNTKAKCIFQLRIRPGSYKIGQETFGFTAKGKIIDENFNNNKLEWYTKENVGIVVHGLLIKIV